MTWSQGGSGQKQEIAYDLVIGYQWPEWLLTFW